VLLTAGRNPVRFPSWSLLLASFACCLVPGFSSGLSAQQVVAQRVAETHSIGGSIGGDLTPRVDDGGTEADVDAKETETRQKILRQAGPSGECDRLTEPKELKNPKAADYKEMVDWEKAVSVCQQALDAHPDDPHFHLTFAIALSHVKRYIDANRHYKIAAEANIPAAISALGTNYFRGLGIVKDDQKAFELWSKAAAAGWPPAMGNLGSAYADGVYVKKDPAKSLDWFEKSIEAGNITSLSSMGNAYLNGNGALRDFTMAAQYFKQAADLGDGFGLKSLANMYEVGFMGAAQPQVAGALRLRAAELDPDSQDPSPPSVFKTILAASKAHPAHKTAHTVTRHYAIYRAHRFYGCMLLWC